MAAAATCNPSDWSSLWRDRRQERIIARRISEASSSGSGSSSSEEGWGEIHNHEHANNSRNGGEEGGGGGDTDFSDTDDDTTDDDDEGMHNEEDGSHQYRSKASSHSSQTGVDCRTGCKRDKELALRQGMMRREGDNNSNQGEEVVVGSEGESEDFEDGRDEEEEEENVCLDEDDDDEYDEGDFKTLYHHDAYVTEMFGTLSDFRASSLLTDVVFCTWSGGRFRAHATIVAAVSYVMEQKLRLPGRWNQSDIYVNLGPEVTDLGLTSLLEFAYTGNVADFDPEVAMNIRPAAQCLCAERVLEFCSQREEEWKQWKMEERRKSLKEHAEKAKRMAEERARGEEEQNTEENIDNDGGKKMAKIPEESEEERTIRLLAAKELEITLQRIRELWVEKVGCDVILQADVSQRTFHTHRVILAACSDYFRAMFTCGLKESKQWAVRLHAMTEEDLDVFLLSCYSGSMLLSWDWVFDFACLAIQFQLQPAMSVCYDFMRQEMDADSCLDVASFAEAYQMDELLCLANDFVLRHFQEVSVTPKFLDLPRVKLLEYLRSNALFVPSEIVVLRAVMAWVGACPTWRVKMAQELIDAIKFPLLTFQEFNEAQAITKKKAQKSMTLLYEALVEAFCSVEGNQDSFRNYMPVDNMVLVGGDGITPDMGNRRASRELWYSKSLQNHTGIIKRVEWKPLGELPEKPRFCHEVAVLDDMLYVCGGRHYYGTNDVMKSMYRYDLAEGSWHQCADMQMERCQFAMVVLEGMIYAIGGEREADLNVDTVERYCPRTDSWSYVCPLDQPMSSHAASVWDGQIYVSGGFNCEYQSLVSMFLYHPERGTTYLADLPCSRAQHRMELLADQLYMVGGVSPDADGALVDQLECDVYDPEEDFWWRVSPVPSPHVGAASAVLEGKVYILGGYTQEDYSETKLIHRYDPAIERWENMGQMPGPITDIRACSVNLPSHLKE